MELPRLEDVINELSRRDLMRFIERTMPKYSAQWFHRHTCQKIENWINGEGKPRLMIFIPPQHGKSQISTRHTPAWILGNKPDTKVAIAAYNGTVASKFNRDVQRIIEQDQYRQIFPEIKIPAAGVPSGNYVRNNTEFELVGEIGGLVSVGVGGGLTSRQVDVMIIDDVYKDAKEAWSPIVRQSVSEWYSTVVETRLHNDSKVLIVFTRWHENDLGGELLKSQPDDWEVVKFPAIKFDEVNPDDPREYGEALWEGKHGAKKLLDIKKRNRTTFDALYQQEPKAKEGLLYGEFQTYAEMPELKGAYRIEVYCDSADTGSDYLCSILYTTYMGKHYVQDIVYVQDGVEITEKILAKQFIDGGAQLAQIEANAGGRIFARNVERVYKNEGGKKCVFKAFHQTENKEARIYSNAASVTENILMPVGWHMKFPVFYEHVTSFSAIFKKNKHDDCADALTGVVERSAKHTGQYYTAST